MMSVGKTGPKTDCGIAGAGLCPALANAAALEVPRLQLQWPLTLSVREALLLDAHERPRHEIVIRAG